MVAALSKLEAQLDLLSKGYQVLLSTEIDPLCTPLPWSVGVGDGWGWG